MARVPFGSRAVLRCIEVRPLVHEADDLVVQRAVLDLAALAGIHLLLRALPDRQWLRLEVTGEVPADDFSLPPVAPDT